MVRFLLYLGVLVVLDGVEVVIETFYVHLSQLCIYSNQYNSRSNFLGLYSKQEHGLWVSTCFLVTTQTMNMALACSRSTDTYNTLRGSLNCRNYHDLGWLCRPFTSTWPPVAARPMNINMDLGGSPDHEHLHALWWRHRPQISTQTWAAVGPLTQTWPWASSWIKHHHGLRW